MVTSMLSVEDAIIRINGSHCNQSAPVAQERSVEVRGMDGGAPSKGELRRMI